MLVTLQHCGKCLTPLLTERSFVWAPGSSSFSPLSLVPLLWFVKAYVTMAEGHGKGWLSTGLELCS